MTLNSRRPSIRRHPFLFGFLLLALLLVGVAGLTAPVRRAAAEVFAGPDISKARKVPLSVTVPLVAGKPALDTPETEGARIARLRESYGKLPLSFEANQGQTDSSVKFLSRGSGYSLFLTPTEAVLRLQIADRGSRNEKGGVAARSIIKPRSQESAVLRMKVVGANPASQVVGVDDLRGKSNYFIGNDPTKWQTKVSNYAKVKYEGVYPGVDLVYYGNQQHLEYDFIVAPGADPTAIKLAFEGAQTMRVGTGGDIVLRVAGAEVRWQKPVIYQEIDGVRQEVSGSYVIQSRHQVGFRVGVYDPNRPLIIDPVLVYSTYLGGSSADFGAGIAVDSAGYAYVTGRTSSTNFPTTPAAIQTTNPGTMLAFVTKLDPTGSTRVYSTYLGGGGNLLTEGDAIAVDGAGSAHITGKTYSPNFPTTAGAVQTTHSGIQDGFVTKLDVTGSALVYSTYLGGSDHDLPKGIAVDGAGSAYVTGQTSSTNFPTTQGAYQTASAGSADAFVTKLDVAGSTLVYSTYLGGGSIDSGIAIAVDGTGRAYVTGDTSSTNFPTTQGAYQTAFAGSSDVFVTKLDETGSALAYSTLLGGGGYDIGEGIAVDGSGGAYVTGRVGNGFPTTLGAVQTAYGGSFDAFVTKLNATGSTLVYSTYLGGNDDDGGFSIAVNGVGSAYVTGRTYSTNFPTTPAAIQTTNAGRADAFVTKLNVTGTTLVYSTYLGGGDLDRGAGIAVDGAGIAYVMGGTSSPNFPTTTGAFDTTLGGPADAFVAKIELVIDTDGDGVLDDSDNCPNVLDTDQTNTDGDSMGDACDSDDDNDGWGDGADNCPLVLNNQADADTDGAGDACDTDDDNDGSTDEEEAGAGTNPTNADTDGDGLVDGPDNCPAIMNADQADSDSDGLGNACDPINGTSGLSYETLHHISFGSPIIQLAGFDFDPQNRPALGWREASGNGGVNNFRWSRRENTSWVVNTLTQPGGGIRAAQADFILRPDGTPFFAYAIRDAFIFGQEWYTAHIVDLSAEPTGHGSSVQPIESGQSCIAAYPTFAMDFAPTAAFPSFLVGTACSFNGWLALNNITIHGAPAFRTPAGTGAEFHSIDYATGPDGSHHVTYFAERGGPDGWGVYYSNGSPGHEIRLLQPHRNRRAETSVAVGLDGRIHVAIGGAPLCNNASEGGLLYLTSTDGVNWTRTFVDSLSGRSPSIMLDADGDPHIAYWRFNNEVRYASLAGGQWSVTPVYTATAPSGFTSVKLAFDAADQSHVLFFNPDTSDITIASGAHSNVAPLVTNPGVQTSAAGDAAALQIEATDTEAGALTYSACNLPPGLSIDPTIGVVTGTVTPGTPGGNYDVTVTVNDPAGNTVSVGFVWKVKVNSAPALTAPGDRTNAEGDTVSLSIAATDPDNDALNFSATGLPPGLSINPATGVIGGILDYDSAGTYPINVTASDGALSTSASFNWTVTNVNRDPMAVDSAATTAEDTSVEILLAASDADGDALGYTVVVGPTHGTIAFLNGVVTYTPAPNFNGADSFTFRANDGTSDSNIATVSINVSPLNDSPQATADSVTTNEDTPVTVNILTNDTDPDSDALSIQTVVEGVHGTVAIVGGAVIYTPDANYHGPDSFTYTILDGQGGTSEATVSINVNAVNDAPVAAGDTATTAEDASVNITILSNDTDVDGDAPALASITQPANGVAAINPDGSVSYTPAPNYFGGDSFTYTASDGHGGTATATVNVTVSPVNDAPTALDSGASTGEDTPVEITLAGADIDSATLSFAVVTEPLNGTLSAVAGDKVIYTPKPNFNGTDSFTFIANDGAANSNVVTKTIIVAAIADTPILATIGNQVVAEGTVLSFTLSASDPDGEPLTYSAEGLPTGATLDPVTGAFSWTPTYEQAGLYTLTFTVTDPTNLSGSETVTITINDVVQNLGPLCSAAYPSISEIWPPNHHQTQFVSIFGITDPDNDAVTIMVRQILQDEPTNTNGDGTTWIDGGGLGTSQAWVRAERAGTKKLPGNGRVYEIFFDASDGRGKSCTGSVKIGVPHDQGKGAAVDDGKRYDSTVANGPCLNCNQ